MKPPGTQPMPRTAPGELEGPSSAGGYLPLKALASYSGLSVRTLRDYLMDPIGPLPHYRIAGKILVRRSEYDAWVQRFRRRGSNSLGAMIDDLLHDIA